MTTDFRGDDDATYREEHPYFSDPRSKSVYNEHNSMPANGPRIVKLIKSREKGRKTHPKKENVLKSKEKPIQLSLPFDDAYPKGYNTYEGWKKLQRQVTKGEKYEKRGNDGKALFHENQTKPRAGEGIMIWNNWEEDEWDDGDLSDDGEDSGYSPLDWGDN